MIPGRLAAATAWKARSAAPSASPNCTHRQGFWEKVSEHDGRSPRVSSKGRILVVDDEANARLALAELLRDEGYDVETAADAFKALGKLDEFAPHLGLTDLKRTG